MDFTDAHVAEWKKTSAPRIPNHVENLCRAVEDVMATQSGNNRADWEEEQVSH